jgi:hypothetical protein
MKSLVTSTIPLFIKCGFTEKEKHPTDLDPWGKIPKILKRIISPKFPQQDFTLKDEDRFDNESRLAIQNIINKCSAAGGGRVIIPRGKYCYYWSGDY